ncbi:MAG TPA: hypothetical protein VLC10_01210, partial [Patescibacteria group bacterium]|nr:hypothetical protein [Patescibacteria group bacterium]
GCGEGNVCEAGRCVAAPVPPTAPASCGNGSCDAGETADSCAADCAAPPSEETPLETPAEAEQRSASGNIRVFAGANGPELSLSYTGEVLTLPSMTVRVYVPDAAVRKTVKDGYILFGGRTYPLRETRSYEALVTAPSDPGSYKMTVVVNYEDGTADAFALTLTVEAAGMAYEKKDGKTIPVAGATVTLFIQEGGGYVPWQPGKGGSANPQATGAAGTYAFLVPSGTYKIRAEKDGYATKETLPFASIGGYLNVDLELVAAPKPLQEALAEALASGSVAQRAGAVASALAGEASYRATVAARDIKEFADNPIVEKQTEQIAAPAVVVVATANVAAGAAATATAVPYAMYLVSFIAHPTLLIARRRRKKWGTVYNALTKLPLDLAIVRLVDAKTGRIVRSAVTDKEGRYFFIVPRGEYKLIAIKAGYVFPTSYLKSEKQDVALPDLYHGENVAVQEEASITANIPLDPSSKEKTPNKVVLEGVARRLQSALAVSSVLAMAVATSINPSPTVIAIFAGNAVMFLVFRRLAVTKKPKNWGIVYDDATGKPVQSAVARIFDTKYNKLLETQVTDARGRYAFLVGDNVYLVTFEKSGYMKQQKGPVNLTHVVKKGVLDRGIVAVDVRLPKAAPAKPAAPPQVPPEEPRYFPAAPPIPPRSDMPAGVAEAPAPPQPGTPQGPGIQAPPMPEAGPGPVVPTPYQGIDFGPGPPRAGPTAPTGPPSREGPAGEGGTPGSGVVTGEPPKTSSP